MWFNVIIFMCDAFFTAKIYCFLPDLAFCLCLDLYRTAFTPLACGCCFFEPNPCPVCGEAVVSPYSRKLLLLTVQNHLRRKHSSHSLSSDMGCHDLYVSQVVASVSQDIARFYWFVLNCGFIREVYRRWRYTARHSGRTWKFSDTFPDVIW